MEFNYYNCLKFFHIIFVTTWMAGLFYIPRLFVYHSKVDRKSNEYKTFLIMEKKLMKYIMNPSFIFTWIFGFLLVLQLDLYDQFWINLKFIFVFFMSIFHMYCARIRKTFEKGVNKRSENFYRYINEIPTVLFLIIVFLVIFKPSI